MCDIPRIISLNNEELGKVSEARDSVEGILGHAPSNYSINIFSSARSRL